MFVGCRTVLRKPEVGINDALIRMEKCIKYLGIVIDEKMIWKSYVVAGRTWGTSAQMQKTIYRGASALMIQY